MAFNIKEGTKEDLPLLLALIKELAEFERAPEKVTNSVEAMEKDGFGSQKIFNFFICYEGHKPMGMAVTYYRYSTWRGRTLYLEDIYIRPEYRGKGYGKKTLSFLAKYAIQTGCSRMGWQVLDWNTDAISFYQTIGSHFDNEWVNCSLEEENLTKLAELG